ncbi:MAG: glycine cleavage system protein GcvH [Ignavibacteriales bacterium]|jgi:glycine cleavage system H protein|nr:glycine cleavage system protein GcvH [Ignavibacteriales bacterium]MBK7981612.1 glycine cleavage system protein GcvH [Ignavibacteriota bacterium]
MNIPSDLKYTKDHEWIKVEGSEAKIGITEYAQGELGDIVFVDISSDISEIIKGEPFGTIEAVKTVSDLFAPCNGKVLEINSKLTDKPELINNDPYGEGWIIKIEITSSNDLDDLLDSIAYQTQITA